MKKLSKIELEFISNCPNVLYEEVVRPTNNHKPTIKEKLNNTFADVSTELTSYTVNKDNKIRDIHNIAYLWGKDEDKEIINEVISSYCPIKMNKNDISILVDSALNI